MKNVFLCSDDESYMWGYGSRQADCITSLQKLACGGHKVAVVGSLCCKSISTEASSVADVLDGVLRCCTHGS
jgi:hypothetical protein